jgi:hypothetical protein
VGQSHDAGDVFVEVVLVVGDAGGVRSEAREEGGTGGIAVRELAVGAFEEDAALGEGIEIWSFGVGMAVAAEVGGEVVGHEEEDVGTGGLLGRRIKWEGEWEEENQSTKSEIRNPKRIRMFQIRMKETDGDAGD